MTSVETLRAERLAALRLTEAGPPARTANPFFGVGPITDLTAGEVDARLLRFEFDGWLERNYRKLDDKGNDVGPFTTAEIGRSMHRGYPADNVLLDMMREIHRYFGFPKSNQMAVGLGGGHSGFTACLMHLMSASDDKQRVYVDTPAPETEAAGAGGFFRQSWGAQLVELHRYSKRGDERRIHFAAKEGTVPSADYLRGMGIQIVLGVGHETTGATTYTAKDISNLLEWLRSDPDNHHAVLDATSLLGAMPWGDAVVRELVARTCMFMPFQKAIGGVSGYFVATFTPAALRLIERNQRDPSWAIPRQLKIAVPVDPKRPLSGERSVALGPIYDPQGDKMLGGVINTYSTLAFAETTFGLLRSERRLGPVEDLNRRSMANRDAINDWVSRSAVLGLSVTDPERRGAAVTLLKVVDPALEGSGLHARIIARSKQLLGYEGITHPDGSHEAGLDVARYVNAFPGTPGDYRAWIGGVRAPEDVIALLENLQYAYLRAKATVIEEELAKLGDSFPASSDTAQRGRKDQASRAYTVLIADLIGLRFGPEGTPDHGEVRAHIKARGGVFHLGSVCREALEPGRVHFSYQPDLSVEADILRQTDKGQYDAVIAAATVIPKGSVFAEGGVRIGAGTGNMQSLSWGGANGGGAAPLMNTPSFNSRATAQMALKAMLRVVPDLPVDELHQKVVDGHFDTGKNLRDFPTEKIEGKKIAIIGYGNIGSELAKLCKALHMRVAVHARPNHREWIEAEGYKYAPTLQDAARGADFISPHTGLGAVDQARGRFANVGLINGEILSLLNDGAVVVNYDRGEVVDAPALGAALESGKVRHAAVDADIFFDGQTSSFVGPMIPYRDLALRFPGKFELLPHAAADTDHPSRVAGAKQAVDQILDAILYREIVNRKGELPADYVDGGSRTVPGIGKPSPSQLDAIMADQTAVEEGRRLSEGLAAIYGALSCAATREARQRILSSYGDQLTKSAARLNSLFQESGF
ncbi:MAG: phosphoglycerate dehydrogenase [Mesorhizobium sp.]|nr:phosphoglycerate dehydrogenase [bacterium M00.F.Ca.ET.205.01.1.1]TGU55180.1 phosphoglycerate dehydrogenase [bacterium M00.F.Ca.ET.152.01.1.1]TGV40522.1 phosphoglycerate dehydrogenase [Mesorhizobium sp. M00.F.Ca.ET.186.01.1.1]TGZ45526.1 phosphoglycerate dehydrogenase [bacterium M00.F.Ca.ET.162.01.1.1]TIW61741.1 MAG: phosphoglycerate dehydrogenase [Mesorhizobium sp.]